MKTLCRIVAACALILSLFYANSVGANNQVTDEIIGFCIVLNVLAWVDEFASYNAYWGNRQRSRLKSLGLPRVDAYYDFAQLSFKPGMITLCLVILVALGVEIIRILRQ